MPLREGEATMPAEAARNRLLRRVDWRFLLPNPWPERSICFSGGELGEAVAAISHYSTCGATPALLAAEWHEEQLLGSYDLAVMSDPDAETIATAWAALRPGGVCYGEWSGLRAGNVRSAQRALQMAGFGELRAYWPWPSGAAPSVWLPLQSKAGLRVWRALRMPSGKLLQRLAQRAKWTALWLAAALDVLPTISVIGYKPDALADRGAMIAEEALGWVAGDEPPQPGSADCLLLTGGMRSINKVVGVVIGKQGDGRCVVKLARVPESNAALRREAATLAAVHALTPGGLTGAPKVLFVRDWQGGVALGESLHVGQPMWQKLTHDNYQWWAFKSADWLAQLAENRPPAPRRVWWNRLVATRLVEFEAAFGDVVAAGLMPWCRQVLDQLGDLPLVCEQRDFAPWNVLAGRNEELIVLDWESAELQGLPGTDLIYFLTHLAFFEAQVSIHRGAVDGKAARAVYRATWDELTPLGRMTQAAFMRYADRCGLDRAVLLPLRLLTWLIHTASEMEHLAADAGGARPSAPVRRESLFLGLLEEEYRLANHAEVQP